MNRWNALPMVYLVVQKTSRMAEIHTQQAGVYLCDDAVARVAMSGHVWAHMLTCAMHAGTDARMHGCMDACMDACMHERMTHARTHAHITARTHARTYLCMRAHTQGCTYPRAHAHEEGRGGEIERMTPWSAQALVGTWSTSLGLHMARKIDRGEGYKCPRVPIGVFSGWAGHGLSPGHVPFGSCVDI